MPEIGFSDLLYGASSADADTLWYGPPSASSNPEERYLVYFVTGNPGVISYYTIFLRTLSSLLGSKGRKESVHVTGSSLPGFEFGSPLVEPHGQLPASLDAQIYNTESLIQAHLLQYSEAAGSTRPPRLILVAHSVGAYITLEMLRRRNSMRNSLINIPIIGCILIFPTLTHIDKSRKGLRMTPLLRLSYFIDFVVVFVKVLTFFCTTSLISWFLKVFVGMPSHGATATANFLKSPKGIKQALYMACTEMDQIHDDAWGEDIWGPVDTARVHEKSGDVVPLICFYASNDGWISNQERDNLISNRGRREGEGWESKKPQMHVDDGQIPHDYVMDYNEEVAGRVRDWVEELVLLDRKRRKQMI